jgi:hypothetical protein
VATLDSLFRERGVLFDSGAHDVGGHLHLAAVEHISNRGRPSLKSVLVPLGSGNVPGTWDLFSAADSLLRSTVRRPPPLGSARAQSPIRFLQSQLSFVSWNDPVLPNATQKCAEHLLGIDAIMKTGAPRLYGAGDVLEAAVENEVAKGPRSYLRVRYRLQLVFVYDTVIVSARQAATGRLERTS